MAEMTCSIESVSHDAAAMMEPPSPVFIPVEITEEEDEVEVKFELSEDLPNTEMEASVGGKDVAVKLETPEKEDESDVDVKLEFSEVEVKDEPLLEDLATENEYTTIREKNSPLGGFRIAYFDADRFITEVEQRPAIWDPRCSEYRNKLSRMKAWEELCDIFAPDFKEMDSLRKNEAGKQLQRRWKSLRECFRRELKLQKGRSTDGATNKRKYIYFDQLSFLATTFNERETTSNFSAAQDDQDEEHGKGDAPSNSTNADIPERPNKQRKTKGCPKKGYEEELIDILKKDCDEDKAFMMSLLPKFKKFNYKQRFEAQMEIMKVMRRVQLMPAQGPSTSYHGNVPSTSNFQPYVASPGIPQHIQRHLPTHGENLMHQHQLSEGQPSTQDYMHPHGYSHNQHYQHSLHHARPGQVFSQSASNINTDVLSPASERSLNLDDTDLYELS